jgi:hypothetical protein
MTLFVAPLYCWLRQMQEHAPEGYATGSANQQPRWKFLSRRLIKSKKFVLMLTTRPEKASSDRRNGHSFSALLFQTAESVIRKVQEETISLRTTQNVLLI